ncbi:MAG: hypothetical protein JNJ77_06585 [Planctomycetia bacterium]|nr:hypothetical protein [Planctomycetia bacterium]
MRRTTRWVSITFCSLIVGCLLGMTVAGVLYFRQSPAELLNRGEAAFQAGTRSCERQEWSNAQTHFQESLLSAEKLIQLTETNAQNPAQNSTSPNQHLIMGKGLWLKYRAMKSSALVKQMTAYPADSDKSKPPADIQKLSPLRIADDTIRRDAILTLRDAAYRLRMESEVLDEAISVEIQLEPLHWDHLHAFTTTQHELKPDDARTLYLMAKMAYEQLVTVNADGALKTVPAPLVKRSREKMKAALKYLDQLNTVEKPARWRTTYLQAQILAWLSQRQERNTAEDTYISRLSAILFHDAEGIDARLQVEKEIKDLSHFDITGLFGLHQMKLEAIISRNQLWEMSGKQSSTPRIAEIQDAMQKLTAISEKVNIAGRRSLVASNYVNACLKVMPALITDQYDKWCKCRDHAVAFCRQAMLENAWQPMHSLQIADVLVRDAQWLEAHRKTVECNKLYHDAEFWIDTGIKACKPGTVMPGQLALHDAKLKLLIKSNASTQPIQQQIALINQVSHPTAQAIGQFYSGLLAHREGRLQQAQFLLEKAAASKQLDLYRRATTQLIPVYLALEKAEHALHAIDVVSKQFSRLENQRKEDLAWYDVFLRSGKEWLSEKIQAHILAAHDARKQLRIAPTEATAIARLQLHEEAMQIAIQSLKDDRLRYYASMVQYARYLLQWDCLKEVEPILKTLKESYTGQAAVLQLEMGYFLAKQSAATAQAELPRENIAQMDQLIQLHMTHAKAQQACKLIWIKWLTYTNRSDKAEQLLQDSAFFGPSEEAQKLKLVALLFMNKREKVHEVVKLLPRDPQMDVVLLLAAGSFKEQQDLVNSISQTNQNAGLMKAWSAALKLAQGDHAEACKAFIQCLEYTSVRPLVRQGIMDAFSAWSQLQPVEARKRAIESLQLYPAEPCLLLGFAVCCQQLGSWGDPQDTSNQVKDMATALKALEQAYLLENRSPWEAVWIAANMWMQVDMHEYAARLLKQVIELNPQHEAAYPLAIELELEQNSPQSTRSAELTAKAYRKEFPQAAESLYWLGRCAARVGNINEALERYRQLMELQPRHARVYQACCQLLLESANREAYSACQQVLQRWKKALPEDLMAYQYEIQLAARQGRKSEYQVLADRLLTQLEPGNTSTIQTVGFNKTAKTVGRQKADALCLLTQGLIRAGELQEARDMNSRALTLCEDHDVANLLRGDICVLQLKQESLHTSARKTLAQQAVSAYAQHYRQHKGHPLSGNNLAWVMAQELNEPQEAYRIMQEVRKGNRYLEPISGACMSLELLDTMGIIYQKLSKPDLIRERIELFESAMSRYQSEPRVAVHMANAYLAAQKHQLALQAFQQARKILPHSVLSAEKQRELNKSIQDGLNAVQAQAAP